MQSDNHSPFWLPAIHNSVHVPTIIIFNIGTTEHTKLTLNLGKNSLTANALNCRAVIIRRHSLICLPLAFKILVQYNGPLLKITCSAGAVIEHTLNCVSYVINADFTMAC